MRNRRLIISTNNCRSFLDFFEKVSPYFDPKRNFNVNKELSKSLIKETDKFFTANTDVDIIYRLKLKYAYFQHLSDNVLQV